MRRDASTGFRDGSSLRPGFRQEVSHRLSCRHPCRAGTADRTPDTRVRPTFQINAGSVRQSSRSSEQR
jgi:hypothetical protein